MGELPPPHLEGGECIALLFSALTSQVRQEHENIGGGGGGGVCVCVGGGGEGEVGGGHLSAMHYSF